MPKSSLHHIHRSSRVAFVFAFIFCGKLYRSYLPLNSRMESSRGIMLLIDTLHKDRLEENDIESAHSRDAPRQLAPPTDGVSVVALRSKYYQVMA